MRIVPPPALMLAVALAIVSPLSGAAQTRAAAPQHKHYETPADAPPPAPGMPLAPRLHDLGPHTFPVSTSVERAQLFMNQGLNLAFGFNHAEAGRAFAEAARLDPTLAMAWSGQALVLGPNINAAMDPADEPKAFALAQKAVAMKGSATARERAYIDAIAARYTGRAEDRAAADRAFAEAMKAVVRAHPDDPDAHTIYAEALMDLRPWNYWTRDGVPYPETARIQAALENVLESAPNHPGALHLWIHLWEPTDTPERAEAEADRLLLLMPGAGHIVHMPAHIYQRVGRHADVIRSNQMAAQADEAYIAECRAQGLYPLAYYPHNLHFIWMGASASGRRALAIESAQKLAGVIPEAALATTPILQGFLVVPYWAMVRFSEWDRILADPGPRHRTPFTLGVWHFARAMAYAATNQLEAADRERDVLAGLVKDPALKAQTTFSPNTGEAILRIAPEVVSGEIAARRQQWDVATLHLDRAVRYEDALIYQEPPDWPAPVRQNLAGALMAAGRVDEAEAVYWEDLRKNPENGWSLFGLARALEAQGKTAAAAEVETRFKKAWQDADIALAPSSAATLESRR